MDDFEALYRRHCDAVFRFAWRAVGRRDLAEDLTSDAFVALHRHRDRVTPDQLPAWLYAVVKNRAVDYWRHLAVEQRYAATVGAAEGTTKLDDPLEWLLSVKTLKPIHRLCLLLRYGHDLSLPEIAEQTGLSDTQVKGHLQYARQLLRRALAGETR
jgi:RNA polymerase sigma-70 factor, ECF subfamily